MEITKQEETMLALAGMPHTKEAVAQYAEAIVKAVKEGEANPLQIAVTMKGLADLCKQVSDSIKDEVYDEALKYATKDFVAYSAKCTIRPTKTVYHYEEYAEWRNLNAELADIKERMSVCEKQLQTGVVNLATGEILIPAVSKEQTLGVSITLK